MLLDAANSPHRALILAGGGMRVAYQAGVLKALEEAGLSFAHVDGTSGGIMNTAMLMSGLSADEMCDRWRSLKLVRFVSFHRLIHYLRPLRMPGFASAKGIRNKVYPHLGIDIDKINKTDKSIGTFNVCNHSSKTNEAIDNKLVNIDHLVAGVSLPIFMPAIEINGDMYCDAVWILDANLMEAIKRGATEIWLVWCIGNLHEYKGGAFHQYVHMIEQSANGALNATFDYINELNERIMKGDSPYGQQHEIQVHVIKPEYPLPLDPDYFFNCINSDELINAGYRDAYQQINKSAASNLDMATTQMQSPGCNIATRFTIHDIWEKSGKDLLIQLRHEQLNFDSDKQSDLVTGSIQTGLFTNTQPAICTYIKDNDKKRIRMNFVQDNRSYSIMLIFNTPCICKIILSKPILFIELYETSNDQIMLLDTTSVKWNILVLLKFLSKIQINNAASLVLSIKYRYKHLLQLLSS